MKAISKRLCKLENGLGVGPGTEQKLWVVTTVGRQLALDQDTCVGILRKMRVSTHSPFWRGGPRSYPGRPECEGNGEISTGKGRGDLRSERCTMKSLIRSLRRDFPAHLDV